MQDVSRDESRHPRPRRTLRLHEQPQLRRPPGPRWPHPPRLARDGRRCRYRRPFHRHSRLETNGRLLAMISQNQSRAFWWCAAITGVSALVSAGFSLAAVFARNPWETTALYPASRVVAVPFAILPSTPLRSPPPIATLPSVLGLT